MDVEKLFGVYGGVYFSKSVLLGVLNAFLRCPPWCWMVCPPSRGSCLPLSPIVSLLVSLCWMACPRRVLSPFVSHGTPSGFPLLDGVSAFPRVLSPFVSPEGLVSLCPPLYPFLFPFVGWCGRLPEGLVSPCLPLYPLFPFVGWCVRLPEGLVSPCLPLYPFFFSLCWMVCPPSRGSCPSWSPIVPRLVSLCWMVCPRRVLSPFVSHYTPSCVPLLDGVSAFPRVLSPPVSHCTPSCFFCWMVCWPSRGSCLPLSPIVPLVVSLGWCARLTEGLVSPCLPLSPFLFPFVG